MDIIYQNVAGLDLHKETTVAAVRSIGAAGKAESELRVFGTMTRDLLSPDWLAAHGVTHVAMEATGVLWKPVWNILDGRFELLLVNPRELKQVPGRKSDIKDAQWIAQGNSKGSGVFARRQCLRGRCLRLTTPSAKRGLQAESLGRSFLESKGVGNLCAAAMPSRTLPSVDDPEPKRGLQASRLAVRSCQCSRQTAHLAPPIVATPLTRLRFAVSAHSAASPRALAADRRRQARSRRHARDAKDSTTARQPHPAPDLPAMGSVPHNAAP